MIHINFSLKNPYCKRFDNPYSVDVKVSKYKSFEFNVFKTNTIIEFDFSIYPRMDHGGTNLELGLFGYNIALSLYDIRHWNDDTNSYDTYEEA